MNGIRMYQKLEKKGEVATSQPERITKKTYSPMLARSINGKVAPRGALGISNLPSHQNLRASSLRD